MTSPNKPWEGVGTNLRSERDVSSLSIQSSSGIPDVNVNTVAAVPPPLPPRPSHVSVRRSGIGGPPHMYRSYPSSSNYMGYGGYGNYGVYNGMGGYGGNHYPGYMLNCPNPSDANNRFIALAEENTRPAFESIESVVRAFGSVSFMLESTLGALHASFRAALGVADHLSHLRNILSALSVFRLLQWIIRRIKKLFGVKIPDTSLGSCWGDAVNAGEQVASGSAPPITPVSSQWPLGAFLGVVLSGSYLAWRLLAYVMGSGAAEQLSAFRAEENEPWVQGKDSACFLAVASHDFLATTDQEMSFRAGDRLVVAPRSRQPLDGKDWLLAAYPWIPKIGGHPKIGLVPSNYVRFVDRRNIRMPGSSPLLNPHQIPVPGIHDHVPIVPNYRSLNKPMNAPSFPMPQPGVHPGVNLEGDISPQLLLNNPNSPSKSAINVQPISGQKADSEAASNNNPASLSSSNEISLGNSNITGRPIFGSSRDHEHEVDKPVQCEAEVQPQSAAQNNLPNTKD